MGKADFKNLSKVPVSLSKLEELYSKDDSELRGPSLILQ
jgi:hypothetical protein